MRSGANAEGLQVPADAPREPPQRRSPDRDATTPAAGVSARAQDGLGPRPSGCGSGKAPPPERFSNGGRPRVHGDGGGGGCWLAQGGAAAAGISELGANPGRGGSGLPLAIGGDSQSCGTRRRSRRPSDAREGAGAGRRVDMSDHLRPASDR